MLEIKGLTKQFNQTKAVNNVSITIPTGQMVGVIGRSGAGKSTLLRMINRLEERTAGDVLFNGKNISALSGRPLLEWRGQCAMIFQQFNLVPRLDVLTNVLLGRISNHGVISSLFKHFSEAERAMAVLALERLDMASQALQRADTLSGGQQQRVAIARAMMQQPALLLADEPIASLDPRSATMVMDALRRINQEDGITVLCNLHTLDTARQYCDRIIAMFHGEVVFDNIPSLLTQDVVRRIYGVEAHETLREETTSNSGNLGHNIPVAAIA